MNTEFIFIRHAPVANPGRLAGRSDVLARLPARPARGTLAPEAQAMLSPPALHLCSPAQRCRQTARWLWPGAQITLEPLLWEQNFGDWEDKFYHDLPDLGLQDRESLARHCPPNGESFIDVVTRVQPLLEALNTEPRVVIMAHAGIIRAALGLALEMPSQGLAFGIDTLSLTQLRLGSGGWQIGRVNQPLLAIEV